MSISETKGGTHIENQCPAHLEAGHDLPCPAQVLSPDWGQAQKPSPQRGQPKQSPGA